MTDLDQKIADAERALVGATTFVERNAAFSTLNALNAQKLARLHADADAANAAMAAELYGPTPATGMEAGLAAAASAADTQQPTTARNRDDHDH
jgi:hypothetical protein